MENKKIKRRFIKEAIGTRYYFSYRVDLFLYKLMLSILFLLTIFLITSDWNFSILIAAEVFVIFTFVNKLHIDRKKNEGEEKLISKMKREHFKKKLDEINSDDFEMLVGFLFEKKGCKNFVKKKGHLYLTEKDGLINCIKVYKLYDDIELEKIDLRNLVSFMYTNNIKIAYLVLTGKLSEEALGFLDKFKDKLQISVIDIDNLYDLMEEENILPGKDYFYQKVNEEAFFDKKKKYVIKNNIFDNKKIFIYILASIFFYISSLAMPLNNISRYISYYFMLLTVISILYFIWIKYIADEAWNKN